MSGNLEQQEGLSVSDPRFVEAILREDLIGSFAPVRIRHFAGSTPITQASAITLRAVSRHPELFHGVGVDWGCGTGCIAVLLAKNVAVERIIALDVSVDNVSATRENVALNDATGRVHVIQADSFRPLDAAEGRVLRSLRGHLSFVVANPPGSSGDDGFSYRRRVATEAKAFLKPGGKLLLQISVQYGEARVRSLASLGSGLRYDGVLASSEWVPFDLSRTDLRQLFEQYVAEERRGGPCYAFGDPRTWGGATLTAVDAARIHRDTGLDPLTKWQVHEYTVTRPGR